jgi:hypothetical protein
MTNVTQEVIAILEDDALTNRIERALEVLRREPRNPHGKAFHQIAHDEGRPDLAVLWQAVIDSTKGGGFWLGEILLATIERETGFNGTDTRPDRKCK